MAATVWTIVAVLLALIANHTSATAEAPELSAPVESAFKQSRPALYRRRTRGLGDFLKQVEGLPAVHTARPFSNLLLECEFQGSPPPSIDWLQSSTDMLDGETSLDALRPEMEDLRAADSDFHGGMVATRGRLYIDCITRRDQGQYTCQGRTSRGVEAASTQLILAGQADGEDMLLCEEMKGTSFRPARIVQWQPKVLARMGTRVRMVCETTGYPSARVTWSKNHQTIPPNDPRVTVTADGALVISDLQWADMGLYRCTASNQLSSDTTSSFLYPFKA